ncbi:MAG TPA: class II D-tagatose-bisphosphate aldolase, non-catalytic subunit [Thermoclostridium caenicola]|uniref:class II D-tagatose-bisphosphate aldolase, non-catalytic subunit n=1 Tax=Thermoclostridium caenicola TaxID=659425 RepID=UPI002B86C641|nr:class II D-tagatose-bisphosphate aldolase, non-catalytic subunit [Thermoclostridium caenicola]HPO75670.1 class II D-tagatose-bisphosphate aldolase, non-catalytic subunit [Thermoclostridium caenicola]
MKTVTFFNNLIREQKSGRDTAVCSVCSANEFVLEAAMEDGKESGRPVLIEATANQVNQFGGYSGMKPKDFVSFVKNIARRLDFPEESLILGGDHLGPLVWSDEEERHAMDKAATLVSQYVEAGFTKIHIDTTMRLADDPKTGRLPDSVIARRAAWLCDAAEASAGEDKPVYVIGSEVPIPGGAMENEDSVEITKPEDLESTLEAFRKAFHEAGLHEAWRRVVAVVVQPGVEFADNSIIQYDPVKAAKLIDYARSLDNVVLEGHSTDYQPKAALDMMRRDGIAILKVGPALTFALREALFDLERMEQILYPFSPDGGYSYFSNILEGQLMSNPVYWEKYYRGSPQEKAYARSFSLSDRCRYYLNDPIIKASIARLIRNINAVELPFGLLSQYFPDQKERLLTMKTKITAELLIKERIKDVLRKYR